MVCVWDRAAYLFGVSKVISCWEKYKIAEKYKNIKFLCVKYLLLNFFAILFTIMSIDLLTSIGEVVSQGVWSGTEQLPRLVSAKRFDVKSFSEIKFVNLFFFIY